MAARPEGNRSAAEQALLKIADPASAMPPSEVAPRVQGAAQETLDTARQDINAQARPHYDASRAEPIAPQDYVGIADNPAYKTALEQVRAHPILGPTIKDLPDNSVGVVDAVKKHMDDMYAKAMTPQEPQRFLGSEIDKGRAAAVGVAKDASPAYEQALQIGAEGRQNVLNPMERAPIGQLAAADNFPKQAKILFDPNPLPGSHLQVGAAVRAVAAKDPDAARQLVQMYLQRNFDEATQNLMPGPNQAGAAKFAATTTGNAQQARNLEAAVRALPDGDVTWNGLNKMFDVFKAQGTRQAPGSQTEFNRMLNQDLRQGGAGDVAATLASPGKWPSVAHDVYQNFLYGRNTEFFARLFMSPEAVPQLRKLAVLNPSSARAQAIVSNLVVSRIAYEKGLESIAAQHAQQRDQPIPNQ
jgi:hypothetical protein